MQCMPTRPRSKLALDAVRLNLEVMVRLGRGVREARKRRRLTQKQLGAKVGMSQASVSRAERGFGGGLTLDAWQRIALALGIQLTVSLQRDPRHEPTDAGHLGIQELVLRLGKQSGYPRLVELHSRSAESWRSIDVALAADARKRLLVVECWNTFGDVGASIRSSNRKRAEAEEYAAGRWGSAGRAALVWVVRATASNRALVARYPELFAAAFPGSSRGWVEALASGKEPPAEPGLVWASVDGQRIFEWRRRA
jgi:transcriptional regulator with XRE-family HTH domain